MLLACLRSRPRRENWPAHGVHTKVWPTWKWSPQKKVFFTPRTGKLIVGLRLRSQEKH